MSKVTLQHLADREAIREVKARYCRLIDTKQWEQWRLVFADDARIERASRDWTDADGLVADIARRFADAVTVHQVSSPEIVFSGPDSAQVIWAMFDQIERVVDGDRTGMVGYGHYEETYRRVDGEWKIAFLRLARLRADSLSGAPPVPLPGQLRHSPSWLTAT